LVGSPGTEGFQDFIGQVVGSGLAFHIQVVPVSVQGPNAPGAIARALALATKGDRELIVLVRGGGSKADLAAFDNELVVRAVATSPLPVWTGIGHTGDESVTDIVANRAFITPTECGRELALRVSQWWDSAVASRTLVMSRRAHEVLSSAEHRDALARGRLTGAARQQLRAHGERLASRARRLSEQSRRLPEAEEQWLSDRSAKLGPLAENHLQRGADRINAWRRLLAAYDVTRQLERGYTLTLDAGGALVRSAGSLREGAELVTMFADGSARSLVEAVTVGATRPSRLGGRATVPVEPINQ